MTRLFLRFFLGVIGILIAAYVIQSVVFRYGSARQTVEFMETALGGGARAARQEILQDQHFEALNPELVQQRLKNIQDLYDFPVRIVETWKLSLTPQEKQRLEQGDVVLDGTGMLLIRLNVEHTLRFGELPTFAGPNQWLVSMGLGLTMLLVAVGIAFLLRPVALPLRAVERTATAISDGDLSARINPQHVPKGLALATAFNKMAERTETLLRSQKELLEAVSHELRTPLARIRFATDLIETATTEQERKSRLKSVDTATQRLDDLVGELLTYVRLDSDAPDDEYESIELYSLFEDLVDIHAPLHHGIKFDIDRVLPRIHVHADRRGMARAFGNLLNNAGRHARSQVSVRAIQRTDGVMIEVDDDGPGIPPADREKIFDPFVRLNPGDGKGTGLGLALVQRIAIRHGGSVIAEVSSMGGARFSFFIPERQSD
jgi:two-component system sensor histidine kinase RstB